MPPKRVNPNPFGSTSVTPSKNSKTELPVRDRPNVDMRPLSATKKIKTSMFPSLTNGQIEDSDSSLTEPSSDNEDLKDKEKAIEERTDEKGGSDDEDHDDEEEMEWEDVFQATIESAPTTSASSSGGMGDLQLTLDNNKVEIPIAGKKKGTSSQERQTRVVTHCFHVQLLLFHGAVRNSWISDLELHAIMLSHLTPSIMKDVERFQARQGKKSDREAVAKGATDPILKLLGILIHWWKKKFTVDNQGMRKNGYKTLSQFQTEKEQRDEKFLFTTGNREQNGAETYTVFKSYGEKIESLERFRVLAAECKGSRDTGAILFTALLRAIGLEARMIFSLQPLGFGFTERERFSTAKPSEKQKTKGQTNKDSRKSRRGGGKGKETAVNSEESEDGEDCESDTSGNFLRKNGIPNLPRKPKKSTYDRDLPYPIFWSEVYSRTSGQWITVESLILTVLGFSPDLLAKFEPKGKKSSDSKQVIAYVIAYASTGTAKDVTVKYLAKNVFPGKTKGFRIPIAKVPVYSHEGKVVTTYERDWFGAVMRGYRTPENLRTEREKQEDDELQVFISNPEKIKGEQRESISYYRNNLDYVLERHLRRDEAVRLGKSHVKTFTVGKGDKAKEEKVYWKGDIAICKTVENWYREGRVIKEGQQPLKSVKPRVATLNRKREIAEAKRDGETVMQGLYSEEQTELYNPSPIVNGKIPRNSFGNIDIYVSSMIPPGAVHLPLRGLAKLARGLGIDYAEAVIGFEFKKQRAVPMIEGIIVAEENGDLLRDAWRAEEEERKERADGKREKAALAMWRKFLMGLRIVTRLNEEYGDADGSAVDMNPFAVKRLHQVRVKQPYGKDEVGEGHEVEEGGGFFRGDGGDEIKGDFFRDDGDEVDMGGFIGGEEVEVVGDVGGFEIILNSENELNTRRGGDLFVESANSPKRKGTISLRDTMTQKNKYNRETTRPDSEQDMEQSTVSPKDRSTYFMSSIASNNSSKDKRPVASSDPENVSLETPSETENLKLRSKPRIEVQIPITEVTPGRKTRMLKNSETPYFDSTLDIGTPNTTTRRVLKRKVTIEAEKRQSKYFINSGDDSGDDGEGQGRRNRKIVKRR